MSRDNSPPTEEEINQEIMRLALTIKAAGHAGIPAEIITRIMSDAMITFGAVARMDPETMAKHSTELTKRMRAAVADNRPQGFAQKAAIA